MTINSSNEYDPLVFPPFAVTVDIALMTVVNQELRMLLIQRGVDPYKGKWALPGGFVRENESLLAAAERELPEETGITTHLEQLKSYGSPDRDPRMRVVTVAFWAIIPDLEKPQSGTDASHAELVPVAEIESGRMELAFDHAHIAADAIEMARSSLETRTIASRFCQEEFTIAELRNVYDIVWNTALDPGNFQRKVTQSEGFLLPTESKTPSSDKGGRPAALWKAGSASKLMPPLSRPDNLVELEEELTSKEKLSEI